MSGYKIEIKKEAEKELRKLSKSEANTIVSSILELSKNPRPPGCKKLTDLENLWRIRKGNYRIIYSFYDRLLLIGIIRIGHRKDIY